MASNRSHRDGQESGRILARVAREADAGAMPGKGQPGGAPEEEDWAEIWGTRIGRALGPLILLIAALWLIFRLASGG